MIEINQISKKFNGHLAINNISFEVGKGELFGLIGADGAGKTTLFRILTSLLLPTTGSATIFDYDVVKNYKDIRQIVGYMPGRFSLYTDLSVEENLEFFATVFGTTVKDNYDLIRDIYIQIEPFKNRLAGKLSGGMKQKLALSCALIHNPKLLVLDEPTTGVDAVSRKEFWELLKILKGKGITIIVSTPYMDEAQQCDRVALIQNGQILSVNSPGNIVQSYDKNVYSITSSTIYKLLHDLRNFSGTLHAYTFGSNIHYTEKTDSELEHLTKYLKDLKHQELEIKAINPGIEDVFIDLMHSIESDLKTNK